ncbi:Type II secretory pathway component [Idiomarina seosinensis]|uniref:Type II secretory pathway component n=1 Tax=Idiomarina seosinensis TaxID=281739 RepID=UPI00384C0E53
MLRHTKHEQQPEVVINDTFKISSSDFSDALQRCSQKYHKLDLAHSPTELLLGIGHYQAIAVDRPDLPEQDIAPGLAFQLGELVELQPEDMVTDYYELPYQPSGQDKIIAIVANKNELSEWIQAAMKLDWDVTKISIVELQLKKLHDAADRARLYVYPLDNGGYLAQIYQQGQLCFSRALRGLKSISDYSKDEIEVGALEPMATELQRSMDYFESQLRQPPVKNVCLAIKHPQMDAVTKALEDLLAVDVGMFDYLPWMSELCEGDLSDIEALAAVLPDENEQSQQEASS